MYYDRKGQAITQEQWGRLYNKAYKRVAETTLPDGTWVSTVWLGLDHGYGDGPPLIFETMVFPSRENLDDRDCERYSTEADARNGHHRMVDKWLDGGE